jgi:hypothetical protein
MEGKMKYVTSQEAIIRAELTKTEKIISGISEYVGARRDDVRPILSPIQRLLEKSEKENKPIFCIWRHIANAQFESWMVKEIAEKINGIPIWFTFKEDLFVKNNPEKIIFLEIERFIKKGLDIEKLNLYRSLRSIKGKPFSEINTEIDGKSLIDYHLGLRKEAGFPADYIIDLGQIFRELFYLSSKSIIEKFSNGSGMPKKEWYYPILMILSSKLIFLEDFEVCDSEMKKLVDESYAQAVKMGFDPNFVRLKAEKFLDRYMTKPAPQGVPKEIEKIIEEMIK